MPALPNTPRVIRGYYCNKCGYSGKDGPVHANSAQLEPKKCNYDGIPFYASEEEGSNAVQRDGQGPRTKNTG